MKKIILLALAIALASSGLATAGDVYVEGYYRKDGT